MAGTGEKGERRECGERYLWDFRRERAVGMCAFKYINFGFFTKLPEFPFFFFFFIPRPSFTKFFPFIYLFLFKIKFFL